MSPEFFDVVLRQRACRSFGPEPVDDEILSKVLEAATFAPSAENRQPWVFVVVRDSERRAAIGSLTRNAWEGGGRAHSEGRLSESLMNDVDKGAMGSVAAAPVIVVVGVDTDGVNSKVAEASVFPAVQNLLLAASAVGLGSALTTLPLAFGDQISKVVGFPPSVRPMAVVPLGWPERPLGPPKREPLSKKVHREEFGSAW